MGLTERAPHIGCCVINVNTDPSKWENVCQEELTHPVCVGQTNEESTHSTETTHKINTTLRMRNLVSLSHMTPTALNYNYRISLWVWTLGLNVCCLPVLALVASSPVPLHYFIYVFPEAPFCFPLRSFVCCVFCAQKTVCIITLLPRSIMKSKVPLICFFLLSNCSKTPPI